MKDAIRIRNLIYGYDDRMFFDHFNLVIQNGTFTSIAGKNGSGKSTLIQILCGLKKADANIHINGYQMCGRNICSIRKQLGVLLENRNHVFIKDTVREELKFPLENLNLSIDEIKEKVNESRSRQEEEDEETKEEEQSEQYAPKCTLREPVL